jgi:L-cysteine desulfidase
MSKTDIIRKLLKDNIVLATGCTEPVAVALCVAKAKNILGKQPQKIDLFISQNIIKNAMGVGIPGTGMKGLPIAVSLGVVCGDCSQGLDVLNNASQHLDKAKEWLNTHEINIQLAKNVDKLYIECIAYSGNDYSKAIIAKTHQNFIHLQKNEEVILHIDSLNNQTQETTNTDIELSSKDVFEYATQSDISEISWLMDTIKVIEKATQEGMSGVYGLTLGKILFSDEESSVRKRVIAKTCAASDARMDGATSAVYSNSGSGNQGITCTIPIYEFGKELGKTEEEINRALMLSHLMSIYIKQHIGRLSALCGVVNASIGVGCGFVLLQGGTYTQVCFLIKNMINTITGMICDGAKPSCALKISTGLNAAFDCSTLAMRNIVVDETDGISEHDIERSIKNLGKIGRYGLYR